jgi:hypothetical protein
MRCQITSLVIECQSVDGESMNLSGRTKHILLFLFCLVLMVMPFINAACCAVKNDGPIAYIDAIVPTIAAQGEEISFVGHGNDSDGSIVGWRWTSSIDGRLASVAYFTNSSLSVGNHNISFEVQDDSGKWSNKVFAQLVVGATANMDEAIDIVVGEILPQITEIKSGDPYTCLKLGSSLYEGTVIEEDTESGLVINIHEEIFFFYLDLSPGGDYPHTAVYILVDNEGNHDEYDVSWLPRINGVIPEGLTKASPDEDYVIAENP